MKRLLIAASILVCSTAAHAQRLADTNALKNYAAKMLPRCPAQTLTMEPVTGSGPSNFQAYAVKLSSSDEYCGTQKYLLFSPKTQQIVLGSVILLPNDSRTADVRVAEQATQMLGKKVTAKVSPFPLPDGIKAVNILSATPFGTFSYNGYLDASQHFLIVGSRGSLQVDPAKSMREGIGTANAVRRGNPKAPVEIIELSDFECPTCARAHEKIEPFIRKNLSKINYGRLDLPLFEHHEWALQAALGARAIQRVAPSKYWDYVDFIFKNQETVGKQKIDQVVKDFCEDHDIEWAPVQKIYTSKPEAQALLEQVSRAFSIGIASTPTYIVNGQIMGFGPDGDFTMNAIEKAIGVSAAPAAPKPAAKKAAPAKPAAKKPASKKGTH